ncbi:hypothetical protein, partial [Mycobacterium intracellulare]|uniref:hypothetical protein n=1 Tax=Mycobacterium intracellulare TaxID=1767 RepID=UPI0019D71114
PDDGSVGIPASSFPRSGASGISRAIHKAHGLIRGPDGIPPASVWNPIRDEILAHAEFFESDPDGATGMHPVLKIAVSTIGLGWKVVGWLRRRLR